MHIQAKRELFFLKSVKKYNCRNNIVIRLIKEMRQVGSKAFFTFTSKNGLNKLFYYFFRKGILKKRVKTILVLLKTLCYFTIKPLYISLTSRELASAKFFKINNIPLLQASKTQYRQNTTLFQAALKIPKQKYLE